MDFVMKRVHKLKLSTLFKKSPSQIFGMALNTSMLAVNPNKAWPFEGSFPGEGQLDNLPYRLPPSSIIFQEELIQC